MVNPKFSFWFGVWTTVLIGVAGGTVHLTNMLPTDWIPYVVAWSSFFAFVNSAVLTALHGYSGEAPGPLTKEAPK